VLRAREKRLLSGPTLIPPGFLGAENSVMVPPRLMRPISFPPTSVNQMFSSGPDAILNGPPFSVGTENSVTVGFGKPTTSADAARRR
jgi:hypothetical protein